MANLSNLFRKIPVDKAVKKARGWIRGKTGPSGREMLREAERIVRLRTNANYRTSLLKRQTTLELLEELKLLERNSGTAENDQASIEEAYSSLADKKSDEFERKAEQINAEVNLRQNRRVMKLATANALRVAGIKSKSEARKVFRIVEPITEPLLQKGALPITSKAISRDLNELLGEKRHRQFAIALRHSITKANTVFDKVEQLKERNTLYAQRLLAALKKHGSGK